MKNFIFLGPPGSGKGTQAVKLSKDQSVTHLSTGDLLRDAVKAGSELGLKAKGYMDAGDLVPDDLLVGLIESKISSGALNSGFILDGFPRTIPQAESLKTMLATNKINIDAAILFTLADEEIVNRLSGRWFCPTCQKTYNYPGNVPKAEGLCDDDNAKLQRRKDDEPEVVKNRLQVYHKQTQPIEDFYRNESVLREVSATKSPNEVFAQLKKTIS
jgi:adenylate kinase